MTGEWEHLDAHLRGQWDDDVVTADDPRRAVLDDAFPLPRPYVAGGAPTSPAWYTTMFSWDAYFTNLALLVHDRLPLVRDAIENYLAMIGKFGYMPNGNQTGLQTRSQTPVFPDSIARYLAATGEDDLLELAYPALVEEYRGYWLAAHHRTPVGLATNRDLGDPVLDPRLAAEAETGLDWTSLFEGDVRDIAPLITNSALVHYARVLAYLARRLRRSVESEDWLAEAERRAALVRKLCWHDRDGFFYDYNYVTGRAVRDAGATGYWPLWARIATPGQARRCAEFLPRLLHGHGLATTEHASETPFGEALQTADLQWMYPAGWPPLHIIATWGLDNYGHHDAAQLIAARMLQSIQSNYRATGQLFEKYNVTDGGIVLPNSRYGTITLHGWTSASVVLLGRRVVQQRTIHDQLPPLSDG